MHQPVQTVHLTEGTYKSTWGVQILAAAELSPSLLMRSSISSCMTSSSSVSSFPRLDLLLWSITNPAGTRAGWTCAA